MNTIAKIEVPTFTPEAFIEMDIGAMRGRFPTETKGYSDELLFNVCMLPADDLSDGEWSELLVKHQPVQEELDGEGLATVATNYGSRVSAETETAMDIAVTGKEDWQGGPITVRAGLLRDFGAELNGFAIPNSKGGNNPDRYKKRVEDTAGKASMRPTSFYAEFTKGTPAGKKIVTEITFLKRANVAEDGKVGIPADILAMTNDARDDRIKYLENRVSNMTVAYKKAMMLHFQCIAFDELETLVDVDGNVNDDASKNIRRKAGTVGWNFICETNADGSDGDVINSPQPIVIFERAGYDAKGEARPVKNVTKVSVGKFLKFHVPTAIKGGSTFKALFATIQRKPKTKADAVVGDTKTETTGQFVSRLAEQHRFVDEMLNDKDPARLTAFMAVVKADARSKDGGELVTAIVEYHKWLGELIADAQLNSAYLAIAKRSPDLVKKAA